MMRVAVLVLVSLTVALGCGRGRGRGAPAPEPGIAAADAGAAQAAPTRVFIDLRRAVVETQEGARGKRSLAALLDQHQRAIDEEHAALRRDAEAAEKKLVQGRLTRAAAQAEIEALTRRDEDLHRRKSAYQEDVELREKAIFIPLRERLLKVVGMMARKEGWEVTFEAQPDLPDFTAAAVAAYDKAR